MKSRKITKALVLASIVAGTFAAGCELVVDFDRTKIPVDVSEASVVDANVPETGVALEAGANDAGATSDASADAGDGGDGGDGGTL